MSVEMKANYSEIKKMLTPEQEKQVSHYIYSMCCDIDEMQYRIELVAKNLYAASEDTIDSLRDKLNNYKWCEDNGLDSYRVDVALSLFETATVMLWDLMGSMSEYSKRIIEETHSGTAEAEKPVKESSTQHMDTLAETFKAAT